LRRSYFDEIDFLTYNSWLIVCQNRLINVLKGNCTRKSSKDEMAKKDLLIITIARHEEESNSLI